MRVLLAGVSARSAAGSAVTAGFDVTTVDAFGDLDLPASAQVRVVPPRFTACRAAAAALTASYDAAVYLAGFENHPRAVARLASGGALWGNPPDVLRRVRDPVRVAAALGRRGVPVAAVIAGARIPGPWARTRAWLVKPRASGGGHRIRRWVPGSPVPRDCYLQALVEGTPGSVAFVAAGGRAVPLGVFRQLVGEEAFGASVYQYCGNILTPAGGPPRGRAAALIDGACAVARAVAEEFGLVGVNGVDFVVRDGTPYVTEVNPRWTASLELVERASGLSVFGMHAAACRAGALPVVDGLQARRPTPVVGKAVVFSRREVTVGDTRRWLSGRGAAAVGDVPRPGQRIAAGRPVCTVFASGPDARTCHAALARRAAGIYEQLDRWARRIA